MKRLKDYYGGDELVDRRGLLLAICRAYAEKPEKLLLTPDELTEVGVMFELEADWDGRVWGMLIIVEINQ